MCNLDIYLKNHYIYRDLIHIRPSIYRVIYMSLAVTTPILVVREKFKEPCWSYLISSTVLTPEAMLR